MKKLSTRAFVAATEREIRKQRSAYRKIMSSTPQPEIYGLFLDLRLLSQLDDGLARKARKAPAVCYEIPYFHFLHRCSPVFAAVWKKVERTGLHPEPRIESTLHHLQKRWDGELSFPGTKQHVYWVLRFPEPPIVFKDLLRAFSFHWSFFSDAVRMLILSDFKFQSGSGTQEHLDFVLFMTEFLEQLLRGELGEVIAEPLRNSKLISDSSVRIPSRGSLAAKMKKAHDEAFRHGGFSLAEKVNSDGLARFRAFLKKAELSRSGKKPLVFSSPNAVEFERVSQWLGLPEAKR